MHGGLVGKRAADARALALLPTTRELMAAGLVSQRGMANELNRRGIPGAGGGRWHRTTVVRMLTRLSLLTSGKGGINTVLAHRRAADVRAASLASMIREFQTGGVVTVRAIARALNEREISTARLGRWHASSVGGYQGRGATRSRAATPRYDPQQATPADYQQWSRRMLPSRYGSQSRPRQ
jgi:hypothetical protein